MELKGAAGGSPLEGGGGECQPGPLREQGPEPLVCSPIGFLRCESLSKFLTPSQPDKLGCCGVVELLPGHCFEVAIRELSGFSRIWLIWWFHRNKSWRPQVLPPRGRSGRKGVLSTRSPHRPNPIGLSSVALLEVKRNRLYVGHHDLLDGTPILDVKPYVSSVDAFPGERSGWMEQLDRETEPTAELERSELAARQLEWLEEHDHPKLVQRIESLLASDARPHRTRRITALGEGRYVLKSGSWRIFYRLEGDRVRLERVASRYGPAGPADGDSPEVQLHARFCAFFAGQERD